MPRLTRRALRPALFVALLTTSALPTGAFAADPTAPTASASAAPTVAPTPTGAPPSDPCGGPGRLLATLNRPTVGYSACAVPVHAVVLEEGYQNQTQGGASPSVTATYPQGFERVGVAKNLELDFIGPTYERQRTGETVSTGYNDLGLGFKYELPQSGRFTYAIDGLFQAATGTGGFSAGAGTSALDLDVAYMASPAIGIGTTLAGYATSGAIAGDATSHATPRIARYGYFLPSLVVTEQIPNYYQFYVELVGQTKLAPNRGGHVFTDFGLQKLLGPYFEVDAEYGLDFTPVDGSRFRYVGVGVGVRAR